MPEYLRKKGKYLGTLERETSRGNEMHHASHSHDEKFLKEKWAEAKKKLRHLEMMTMMMMRTWMINMMRSPCKSHPERKQNAGRNMEKIKVAVLIKR